MNLFLLRNTWGHNFFENVEATSTFLPSEGWHEPRSILRTHKHWRRRTKFIRPSDLTSEICASWKNSPKKSPRIKYKAKFTTTNFLRAKIDEKLYLYTECIQNAWTNFNSEFFTEYNVNISHKQSANERSFEFNCNITFNNKFLNYAIFYSQVTQHIYITCFLFNRRWVLAVHQVTFHKKQKQKKTAQNVLHLNIMYAWHSCKVPGAVANGLTGIKYALEKLLFNSSRIHWEGGG